MSEPTFSASALADVIEYAAQKGLDREDLRARAGLEEKDLVEFDVRVSVDRVVAVVGHVARSLQDPALAVHLAERTSLERYRLMGFVTMTAPDARRAIEAVIRYSKLLTNCGEYVMTDEADVTTVRWQRAAPASEETRIGDERFICEFVACARQCVGRDFAPRRVRFPHALAGDEAPYRRFFRCPIEWRSSECSVSLDSEMLKVVPSAANPALYEFLHEQAERALAVASDCTDPSLRVREAIARALPSGEPAMADVARCVGMSERTLRRQLGEHGTSFSKVVDEVRAEWAQRLLDRYSVTETAGFLGFSDSSAFSRAFKRWVGTPPSTFRSERRTRAE